METGSIILSLNGIELEVLRDQPEAVKGIALVAHPHPIFGGANSNKVVYTLARTLAGQGFVSLRPNFRGVGKSTGSHDFGVAETADMAALLQWAREQYGHLPLALAGFSFGAFVQLNLAEQLTDRGEKIDRNIYIGTACGQVDEGQRQYQTPLAPLGSLIIHGSKDDVVPLSNLFEWAEPQNLPVQVLAGAGHFFHGRLHIIRALIEQRFVAL